MPGRAGFAGRERCFAAHAGRRGGPHLAGIAARGCGRGRAGGIARTGGVRAARVAVGTFALRGKGGR